MPKIYLSANILVLYQYIKLVRPSFIKVSFGKSYFSSLFNLKLIQNVMSDFDRLSKVYIDV